MPDPPEIDYGPLAGLIGTWNGEGHDVSPEPDGTEESPYHEEMVFEAAGSVDNAESQDLAIVRYQVTVRRKSNDEIFHNQVGYWLWDAESETVMNSFTIPRAVCVVAGGKYARDPAAADDVTLDVAAKKGDADWGIVESPFMRDNASTVAFAQTVTISGDQLTYAETTSLEIYGRSFEHTDNAVLTRQ
jgi:hypothetical protein